VIVVANLAKKSIKGVDSEGMILTESEADGSKVRLLQIPSETPVGEKLVYILPSLSSLFELM
jgi:tRNA-binding EMAP/Myf-like protein